MLPGPPAYPRRLAADLRREQILAAGQRLFSQHGFGAVSMADLARELHVSRPTIYTYFQTPEAILDALLDELQGVVWARLEPALRELTGRPLREGLAGLFLLLAAEQDLLRLLASGSGPSFAARRRAFLAALERRAELLLPARERPPYLLTCLSGLLESAAQFALERQLSGPELTQLADTVARLIGGAASPPPE